MSEVELAIYCLAVLIHTVSVGVEIYRLRKIAAR
jgi:hypothetical protein